MLGTRARTSPRLPFIGLRQQAFPSGSVLTRRPVGRLFLFFFHVEEGFKCPDRKIKERL